MKQRILLFSALLLCAAQPMGAWEPNEKLAGWIRYFYVDKVWQFGDAGSRNNSSDNIDYNTGTVDVPGMLCFNMMTWNNRKANYDDYNMDWAIIYLVNNNTKEEYKICKIYFTGDNGDHSAASEFNEGNPRLIDNSGGNATYWVQKRYHSKVSDGSLYCYFVTKYSSSLRQFVEQASGHMDIKIHCSWDNKKYTEYRKQTFCSVSFMQNLNTPNLNISGWENKDGATQLKYTCQTNNANASTALSIGGGTYKQTTLYNQNLSQVNAYKKLADLGTVTPTTTGKGDLYLTANNSRTYPFSHAYWINHVLCNSAPSQTEQYSSTVTVYAPQFTQPYHLEVQDPGTGIAKLSWDVPVTTKDSYDNSAFIIERYADSQYKDLIEAKSLSFDKNKTHYTLEFPFSDRDQHTLKTYFRVHRDHANVKELCATAEAQLQTDYVKPISLLATSNGTSVDLSWQLSTNGLWTENTKVEIRQGNTVLQSFDRFNTTMTVTDLATCTPYTFTVAVTENGVTKSSYSIKHMLPADAKGQINSLSVSKGFYNDHTTLNWTIDKTLNNFTFFNICRCPLSEIGGDDSRWVTLSSVNHTKGLYTYTYQDNTATPGEYYMYRVEGYAQCDTETSMMDHKDGIGFSQPYGIVAGQITFNGNQGLPNARVVAQGGDVRQGRALHFAGTDSVLSPHVYYDTIECAQSISNNVLYNCQNGTIEMDLVVTTPEYSATFFMMYGPLLFGIYNDNQGYLVLQPTHTPVQMINFNASYVMNARNHVAISYQNNGDQNTITCYVNGKNVYSTTDTYMTPYQKNNCYISFGDTDTDPIDNVRIWNYARSESELQACMKRNLTAEEQKDSRLLYHDYRRLQPRTEYEWEPVANAELEAAKADKLLGKKEGSIEMWVRLEKNNIDQLMVSRKDMLDLRINALQQLVFSLGKNKVLTCSLKDNPLWQNNQYNHVAVSYAVVGSQLNAQLMINGRVAATSQTTAQTPVWTSSTAPLRLGSDGTSPFIGYMDEIRFWNTCRDSAQIVDNMNGYLSGSESGLTAYYRCDDENTGELYDLSKTSSTFNERHMKVVGAYTDPNIVPTAEQLALSTRTDKNGNYVLNAVPYNASGSLYTLTPVMGIHTFSPVNQPLFFSADANTHNRVNFTDESGFTVSGRVVYDNTTYPVQGCQLYIDGTQAVANNQPVTTDEMGQYTITVPIGKHYIELRKDGHTFAANGRFPNNAEQLYDFQTNMVDVNFVDQTYVTLVGRVVGGSIEAAKVHGMQQCVNNIGTATIELSAGATYILNKGTDTRTWATPDGCSVRSKTITGASDATKSLIQIETDSTTGEFAVRVPPIDMQVKKIVIHSNYACVFDVGNYSVLDLGTGAINDTITDSLLIGNKMQYFSYMRALDIIHYEDPTMTFEQKNSPAGAYGDAQLVQQTYDGQLDTIPFYTITDSVRYTFGYPMYQQGHVYAHDVEVYEPYYNYDKDPANPVLDKMPYANVIVTVNNQLGKKEMVTKDTVVVDTLSGETRIMTRGEVLDLADNQIMLDSMGKGVYKFQAGDPNIMADQDYAFPMDINYVAPDGTRTYKWLNNGDKFQGIILGGLTSGTNFVTSGPDQLTYILRDPAGSMSYATWTQKSSVSNTVKSIKTISSSGSSSLYASFQPDLQLSVGVGVLQTVTTDIVDELTVTTTSVGEVKQEESKTLTTEAITEISTGTSNYHVLTGGDVFVGYSTNTLFGNAQTVCLEKTDGTYHLALRDKVTVGEAFNTDFNFSHFYIENTLMPSYLKLRNALDWEIVDPATYNQLDSTYNTTQSLKYFTTLQRNDPQFGQTGTYKAIYPRDWKTLNISGMLDEVNFYNSEYNKWKQILAANEQAKVKAKENDEYLIHNISFDGGSPRTEIYSTDSIKIDEHGTLDQTIETTDFSLGFLFCGGGGIATYSWVDNTILSASKIDTKQTSSTVLYHLEGNTLEAITMDVRQAPDGFGPIFINRGGQTYCPYEDAEKTRYFEPDQHIIHTATVNMQDPKLTVDQPVVTDVPIFEEATFQIAMANRADVGSNNFAWMRFYSIAGSNPYGAKIYVEGKAIAGDGTGDGLLYRFYPGETLHANVSVKQTDISIVDYDSLAFALTPDCEPYTHADTIYLSCHFIPKCTKVNMEVNNRVVNTQTDTTVQVIIYDYDPHYRNLQSILLQYRAQGTNDWNLIHKWVTDSTEVGSGTSLLDGNTVIYQWDLRNNTIFHDGKYEMRAVSQCRYGNELIECEGGYTIITKDVSRPQPLGHPSPINGIWTADNELYVTYNDLIQPDMILPDYVQVKARKNRHTLTNDIALATHGKDLGAYTEASLSVSSRGFSLETWFNWSEPGTVWQHGSDGLSIGVNANGKLIVTTPDTMIVSSVAVPKDQWCYLMFTMAEENDSTASMSAYVAYEATNLTLISKATIPSYQRTAPVFIGQNGAFKMHDMILWSKARSEAAMLSERQLSKELYSDGVIGYWPMNEGRGTTASDALRHRHLVLSAANWWINCTNYAKHVTPQNPETISVATNLRAEDNNYVLEAWLRMLDDGELFRTCDTSVVVSYSNGEFTFTTPEGAYTSEGFIDWSDQQWHQLTVMGNKYGQTVIITDGQRRESALMKFLPDLTRKPIVFGASNPIDIDEVRIWSGDISESWLKEHRYNQLSENATTEYAGLAFYQDYNATPASDRATDAPALTPVGQYESVEHTFTASTEKVVIDITESPANIEGCTLEITVENLLDQNGNRSVPATWTAYVNRNQLIWGESELTLTMANLEETTHTIDIINNSGHSENWTIADAPEWLSFSQTSGTIAPLTTQHLTFTIDPSLAIGTYDEVVYLSGNQGIRTPLYLNVKVTGDEPDWTIQPADYEYSMNLIAVATINGVAVDDKNDRIAAFINGELAGVASPVYNSTYYKYFVMMDIYSNEQKNQPVTFKLWDASTGAVYTQLQTLEDGADTTVHFAANTLVGAVNNPIILSAGETMEQSIALEKGWNWISFNLINEHQTMNEYLQHFIKDITIIKSHTEYAQTDSIRQMLVGSLNTMHVIKSYHAHSRRAATDVVVGYPVNPMMAGITLEAGQWTWIGYIPQMSLSVNSAMANLNAHVGDIIKGRTGFATWDSYQWVGSLTAMVPGQGYMYYNASTQPQILYYPSATTTLSPSRRLAQSPNRLLAFSPVAPGTYQNNMTITARVMDGDQIVTDAEVGVFAGEECRAAATATEELYFLTVSGEQSVTLNFKVARGGEVIVPEQSLTYMTDAVIGDLYAPYIIQIGESSGLKATGDRQQATAAYKVLQNQQVYIIRNGKRTSILGVQLDK